MDPRISNAFATLSQSVELLSYIIAAFEDPEGLEPHLVRVALTDEFEEILDEQDPAVRVALLYKNSLCEITKALAPVMFDKD
jgi:hypothetical protein